MKDGKNIEYDEDGKISYEETIRTLPNNATIKDYPNMRVSEKGIQWIRVGKNAKHRNGVQIWVLNYDDFGNLIEKGRLVNDKNRN